MKSVDVVVVGGGIVGCVLAKGLSQTSGLSKRSGLSQTSGLSKRSGLQVALIDSAAPVSSSSLKTKAPKKTGFHRWYWSMNEKGVNRPSRSNRTEKSEPRGVTVKPGTYKVVLESNNSTSETEVTVKTDPRFEISQKAIDDRYIYTKKIESFTELAAAAVDQLKSSKKTLAVYKNKIEEKDKEANKELLETITNSLLLHISQ